MRQFQTFFWFFKKALHNIETGGQDLSFNIFL